MKQKEKTQRIQNGDNREGLNSKRECFKFKKCDIQK